MKEPVFVTFFSYSGRVPRLELDLLKSFNWSLARAYPRSPLFVLTDRGTECQLKERGFNPFVITVSQNRLMLDRVIGLRAFLDSLEEDTCCIMLDYDTLVLKKFDFLKEDTEVVYTVRERADKQSINGGLALYRKCSTAIRILDGIIKTFEALSEEDYAWWGDQLSLSRFFKNKLHTEKLEVGQYDLNGARLQLVSTEHYNFTPFDLDVRRETLLRNLIINAPIATWLKVDYQKIFMLHFKGPRKHLQLQIWWQLENSGELYCNYVRNFALSEIGLLRAEGISRLNFLAKENEFIYQLNDLAVIAFINFKSLFGDNSTLMPKDFISFLSHHRDFRAKVLSGENYATTAL